MLPWALEVSRAARVSGGIPAADVRFSTFQPSFLCELMIDLLLAAGLVRLGHHRNIRPPGRFALYVAGYCTLKMKLCDHGPSVSASRSAAGT